MSILEDIEKSSRQDSEQPDAWEMKGYCLSMGLDWMSPQMAHPTEIILQFCDSELPDCPFPQPFWSHPGIQTSQASPLWAARLKVQLVHTGRTKLFSTATSRCVIVHFRQTRFPYLPDSDAKLKLQGEQKF